MTNDLEDANADLALAVGLFVLDEGPLPAAAKHAGVTRWEVEEALEDAGLAEHYGLDQDGDVASEIDSLLDDS